MDTRSQPEDFIFSFQRILNPRLASEYSFMLYYIQGAEDFHKNRRCKTLFSKNPNAPLDWDQLEEKLNTSGGKGDNSMPFDQKGLDQLTLAELEQLRRNPSLFTWPEETGDDGRLWMTDQLIAFEKSGGSLWDRIGVGATAPTPTPCTSNYGLPSPTLPS